MSLEDRVKELEIHNKYRMLETKTAFDRLTVLEQKHNDVKYDMQDFENRICAIEQAIRVGKPKLFGMDVKVDPTLKDNEFRIEPKKCEHGKEIIPDVPNCVKCFDDISNFEPKPQEKTGCGICGSGMVYIRGRFPKQDNRLICPCCAFERLEQINEISRKDYGQASQEG